jgi:predicted RNA-binding protein with TRAM domain
MANVSYTVSPRTLNVGDIISVAIENYESQHLGHGFRAAVGYLSDGRWISVESIYSDETGPFGGLELHLNTSRLSSYISGRSASFLVTAWRDDENDWGGPDQSPVPPHARISVTVYKPASRPTVGSVSLSPVQPEGLSPDFAGRYIAGITAVRVRTSVSVDASAAGTHTLRLTWPGSPGVTRRFTGTSYTLDEQTPPVTEDTVFTVTVTDSLGGTGSGSAALNDVLPYVPPSAEIQELGRCDAQGTLQEGGAYYRINAIARIYTELEGNAVTKLTACLNGQSTPDNLTSGVTGILGGSMDAAAAYTVTVTIQDRVTGEQRREYRLAGLLRDFVLKRCGHTSHLGVGCTPIPPQSGSSIQLPAGGSILIGGQDVIAALLARIEALENA